MRDLFARLNGSSGAVMFGILCAVLIAAGFFVQSKRNAEPVSETAIQPAALSQPPAAEVASVPPSEPKALPVPRPTFDEVRREPDGMTVIAGLGAPETEITLLQDGTPIGSATSDRAGKFATIAMIPPDGQAHVLTLLQVVEGTEMTSEDEIILAPLAAPVVIAQAPAEVTEEPQPQQEAPAPAEPAVTAQAAAQPPASPSDEAASEPTQQTAQTVPATESQPAAPVTAPFTAPVTAPVTQPVTQPVETAETTTAEAEQPAPEAVAVLRSTADGVELLNTQSPEVMDNVAIDTISYSNLGDVQLSGRAQADTSAVRVYLDNAAIANLPVDERGRWRGNLPNVDEGIYTLRVDEVAADGQVTSRVETPFKREPASLLAAAAAQGGPVKAITVQQGSTLWAIARDRYGDGALYVRVFEANKDAIRNPDLIYPGQIFDLPD